MTGKNFKVLLLPGDGVGPEVLRESRELLEAIGEPSDVSFDFGEALIGGAAIDAQPQTPVLVNDSVECNIR